MQSATSPLLELPARLARASPAPDPGPPPLRVWVDIDNPPQVQYLLPLAHAFRRRGDDVTLTARDYGITYDLLRQRGETFTGIGTHFGGSLRAKVIGNLARAARLRRLHRGPGRPHVVVSNSRSAALAARLLRIPSFAVIDYEFVNLAAYRLAGSYVVHPGVISAEAFTRRGIRPGLLLPFSGIKEDLSFADHDLDAVPPFSLPAHAGRGVKRVLVRPPAEESHYHRSESTTVARSLLAHLARQAGVLVVFAPRYPSQVEHLRELRFENEPVVLDRPAPFLSLLKAVDAVVSGGGTMIREAAYLGIPAITTFQGEPGAVDAHLESIGRLHVIRSPSDAQELDVSRLERREPMGSGRHVPQEVVTAIAAAAASPLRQSYGSLQRSGGR